MSFLALFSCEGGGDRATMAMRAENAASAFVFVKRDCPVAEAYADEIRQLSDQFTPRGVDFTLVYLDPEITREEAVAHAKCRFGTDCDVVIDSNLYLARLAQVTVTPEVAVVSKEGKILYRGRIDDSWESVGVAKFDPTTRDLRDALDAILDGRAVASAVTPAIGCLVASEDDE